MAPGHGWMKHCSFSVPLAASSDISVVSDESEAREANGHAQSAVCDEHEYGSDFESDIEEDIGKCSYLLHH